MKPETLSFIESCIKTIPDYPKPGILFRDITSLVEHAQAFKATIDLLSSTTATSRWTRLSAPRRGASSSVLRWLLL